MLAAAVAIASGLFRLLTLSGCLAAFAVGFVTFAMGGALFAAPLLTFFLTGSILSRVGRARKEALPGAAEKSGPRDAAQVLANGGIASALALLCAFSHQSRHLTLLYLASFAAAAADTWATEIGSLWGGRPWLFGTLRRTEPGESGGISPIGLLASAAGAAAVVLSGWLAWPTRIMAFGMRPDAAEMLAVGWAAVIAAMFDSAVGATVQPRYRCVRCGRSTEHRRHCGFEGQRIKGLPWLGNDAVNLLSAAAAVGFAHLMLRMWAYPLR
jgi:uncharacterized protein (TIGR00297 family)